jgi:hypothetical protein
LAGSGSCIRGHVPEGHGVRTGLDTVGADDEQEPLSTSRSGRAQTK